MFLKADKINYTYMPGTPMAVNALRDISFSVEQGDYIGIIGSSGSGKSTLLQILAGLITPDKGKILVNGEDTADSKSRQKLRNKVGIVFQSPEQQLFAENVFLDVAFGPVNMGLAGEELEKRVRDSLALVALDYEEVKDKSPFNLSGGEMRRVALAGTIAMEPEILLLDEPTAGLDPAGREAILTLIEKLHREKKMTVIMISHRMEEIARFARKILVFHEGRIFAEGEREKLFSRGGELRDIGLDLPPITAFMQSLALKGKNVRTNIYTVDDACREIISFLSGEVS